MKKRMDQIDWPLHRNIIRRGAVNHTFGDDVRRNSDGSPRAHQGWDFYAEPGYRCYAIADGTVVSARNFGAYGQRVLVKHQVEGVMDGKVFYAFYAHLSRADVKSGQTVKMGDVVGLTGNSGNARSMRGEDQHLHFEIRTKRWVGRGLAGRVSPIKVFGHCPLRKAVLRKVDTDR